MLATLWRGALALISSPRCPGCGGGTAEPPLPLPPLLCPACRERLALPEGGVQGDAPLLWCALAPYRGPWRRLLLRQRPRPEPALIAALAAQLHGCCASAVAGSLLVPIPSWKRSANPLPRLVAQGLAQAGGGAAAPALELLQRSRVTVGQHHLNRAQRLCNQRASFQATPAPPRMPGRRTVRPLWLVDDILTTGATARAAAAALEQAGWSVQGLLCLARTPGPATAVI